MRGRIWFSGWRTSRMLTASSRPIACAFRPAPKRAAPSSARSAPVLVRTREDDHRRGGLATPDATVTELSLHLEGLVARCHAELLLDLQLALAAVAEGRPAEPVPTPVDLDQLLPGLRPVGVLVAEVEGPLEEAQVELLQQRLQPLGQ